MKSKMTEPSLASARLAGLIHALPVTAPDVVGGEIAIVIRARSESPRTSSEFRVMSIAVVAYQDR